MKDGFDRKINYLRISVTDRCNLRCVYCMPEEGIIHRQPRDILSFEQIYRIMEVASGLGVEKVRITGGEPLVRKDLPALVRQLRTISGLKEICLTTNGVHLADYAFSLKDSGLDRVNISLDSLNAEKFSRITRGGSLEGVLKGIDAAFSAGLVPLKLNVVLLKGFNNDEILDFAELARKRPLEVRFIEYMPTRLAAKPRAGAADQDLFFSAEEAKLSCVGLGSLEPVNNDPAQPARLYRIAGFRGSIGFISPLSGSFCGNCNKLRLTSDGRLRSCLHSYVSVDLKEAMEKGVSDEDLAGLIQDACELKPQAHNLNARASFAASDQESEGFSMCQIGG